MSDRNHPIRQILDHASFGRGELPREDELDRLRLSPAHRRKVSDAARVIAATRAGGQNAEARRLARAAADDILDALPEEQQDAGYLDPPDTTPDDPASLADRVQRW